MKINILITGASSGIGRDLAIYLAKIYNNKAQLSLTGRDAKKLSQLQNEIKQQSLSKTYAKAFDISQTAECKKFVEEVIEEFNSIDILILNAGVSMWSKFSEIDNPEQLKKIMEINYYGNTALLFFALPHLKISSGKNLAKRLSIKTQVIIISSFQGYIGFIKHSGYSASKHALHGLVDALTYEEPSIQFKKMILGWVHHTNINQTRLINDGTKDNKTRYVDAKKISISSRFLIASLYSSSSKKCAEKIAKSISSNRTTFFIPSPLKWILFLSFIFPRASKKIFRLIVFKK